MEIDEAKAKKNKSISILEGKGVTSSLQWLMDEGIRNFIQLNVEEPSGQYDDEQIDRSRCFTYNDNKYELYFLGGHSFYTPDGNAYSGMFKLIFNDEPVLETSYSKERPDDGWGGVTLKINFYEFSVKKILLKQWIEETPELVRNEKSLIEKKSLEKQQHKDKEEAVEINGNIDLGDYD